MNTVTKTETWYREPTDHEQNRHKNLTGLVGMVDLLILGQLLAFTVEYDHERDSFRIERVGNDWQIGVMISQEMFNNSYVTPKWILENQRKAIEKAVLKLKSE